MSLSNLQYDELQRQYDARQLRNQRVLQERRAKIFAKYPRLKELEALTASASVHHARHLLDGDDSALEQLRLQLACYRKERAAILVSAGVDEHYFEPPYLCPDCKDTGFVDGRRCHCFEQAAIDLVYTQSKIRSILQEENFSHFCLDYYSDTKKNSATGLTYRETARNAVIESLAFIRQFDKEFHNLFLYGDTGTGKTFLSNCIAKELLDTGHSVIYFTAFQLFDILEKNKFQKDSKAEASMQHMFDCDLLIVDDLGTELANTFTVSQLFLCLNERILRKKATIISTNLGIDQLSTIYSERIFSRIVSSYTMIKLFGDDIRLQKKNLSSGTAQ
ncbi:MAG: ATP-binding protein [Eubacterium sp.]|nr:ATP-binding protein [Eubacterium sp.]